MFYDKDYEFDVLKNLLKACCFVNKIMNNSFETNFDLKVVNEVDTVMSKE